MRKHFCEQGSAAGGADDLCVIGHQVRPLPDGSYPMVRHRCGEPSCLNPIHLAAGTAADGTAGVTAVRGPAGPAADIRGCAGQSDGDQECHLGRDRHGRHAGGDRGGYRGGGRGRYPGRAHGSAVPGQDRGTANDSYGEIEVAAAAASPVVIPIGQGELF